MQEGEIRPLNEDVVLQLDVRNRSRRITVTREALEDFLRLSPAEAAQLTVEQRCHRIQKNLPAVAAAVQRKLDVGNENSEVVVIFAGEM